MRSCDIVFNVILNHLNIFCKLSDTIFSIRTIKKTKLSVIIITRCTVTLRCYYNSNI